MNVGKVDYEKKLRDALKRHMETHDRKAADLVRSSGVPRSNVYNFLSGKTADMSAKDLMAIIDGERISFGEFAKGENNRNRVVAEIYRAMNDDVPIEELFSWLSTETGLTVQAVKAVFKGDFTLSRAFEDAVADQMIGPGLREMEKAEDGRQRLIMFARLCSEQGGAIKYMLRHCGESTMIETIAQRAAKDLPCPELIGYAFRCRLLTSWHRDDEAFVDEILALLPKD